MDDMQSRWRRLWILVVDTIRLSFREVRLVMLHGLGLMAILLGSFRGEPVGVFVGLAAIGMAFSVPIGIAVIRFVAELFHGRDVGH